VAIDVPLSMAVAVSLVYHADSIWTPGAKMSTQLPKFANDARLSRMFVALTVIALVTRAGEIVQASVAVKLFAVHFRKYAHGNAIGDGAVDRGIETGRRRIGIDR